MTEHVWHIRRSPGAVGVIIYCNTHDEVCELTVPEAEARLNENAALKRLIRDLLNDNDCRVHGEFFNRAVTLLAQEQENGNCFFCSQPDCHNECMEEQEDE